MLHQIKAPQFYTDLGLQKRVLNPLANGKIQGLSRPLFFNANFIFKDFSRQSCISKYFSSLCEPCTKSADESQKKITSMKRIRAPLTMNTESRTVIIPLIIPLRKSFLQTKPIRCLIKNYLQVKETIFMAFLGQKKSCDLDDY